MIKTQMTKTGQDERINRIFFIGCPCQGFVLNFENSDFDIVSDFGFRISNFLLHLSSL
jgi:hypothetical protein